MILDVLLTQVLELLENPQFKSFGALQKSKFQHSKGEEDAYLRSDMYKGTKADPEISKKGHITRKKRKNYKEENKKAAEKRAAWYKDPENKKKFMEKMKQRDLKRKAKK